MDTLLPPIGLPSYSPTDLCLALFSRKNDGSQILVPNGTFAHTTRPRSHTNGRPTRRRTGPLEHPRRSLVAAMVVLAWNAARRGVNWSVTGLIDRLTTSQLVDGGRWSGQLVRLE